MSICQALGEIRLARLKPKVPLLFLSLFFLSFTDGCAPRLPVPPHKRPRGIYHVVKGGENLFRIGKAYGVSYRRLAWINRIKDPHQIYVGQRVFIPGATRRLRVKIITPSMATLERPSMPDRRIKGRGDFIWPVKGSISSKFGPRGETFHDGIDIAAVKGSPIRAIEKGKVMYSDRLRGYGNIVIIRHSGGFASVYAHNRRNRVREGQGVARGEVVGEVGNTGKATGFHLHFEIRKNNVARDPLYYLP